jgi:hypothetical protein
MSRFMMAIRELESSFLLGYDEPHEASSLETHTGSQRQNTSAVACNKFRLLLDRLAASIYHTSDFTPTVIKKEDWKLSRPWSSSTPGLWCGAHRRVPRYILGCLLRASPISTVLSPNQDTSPRRRGHATCKAHVSRSHGSLGRTSRSMREYRWSCLLISA